MVRHDSGSRGQCDKRGRYTPIGIPAIAESALHREGDVVAPTFITRAPIRA